jgi:hypothetical protein
LTRLLQERVDPDDAASPYVYDQVVIAGHSQGSVIAYDTLNELLDRARSSNATSHPINPSDLDKLRGLVTFGCPLNKIFNFSESTFGLRKLFVSCSMCCMAFVW